MTGVSVRSSSVIWPPRRFLNTQYIHYRRDTIGIEAVADQLSIIQHARRDGLPVKELKPDRDKVSRALVAAARLEGGTLYWPATAPWLDEWENELLLFPNSRHDDQVDTLAYAAIELAKRRSIDHAAIAEAIGRANASLYRPSPNHPMGSCGRCWRFGRRRRRGRRWTGAGPLLSRSGCGEAGAIVDRVISTNDVRRVVEVARTVLRDRLRTSRPRDDAKPRVFGSCLFSACGLMAGSAWVQRCSWVYLLGLAR